MRTTRNLLATVAQTALAALSWLVLSPAHGSAVDQPPLERSTNGFPTRYYPDERLITRDSEQAYGRNRFLAGESIDEELPSAQDPDGNWGAAVDDLQLSIRFRHHEYIAGKPVVALIILRNLSPEPRASYLQFNARNNFEYLLHHGTNVYKWSKPERDPTAELSRERPEFPAIIGGHAQTMVLVPIDEFLSLSKPGSYSLAVTRRERLKDRTAFTNIVSGAATFQIVNQLSPGEVAATNALYEQQTQLTSRAEQIIRKLKATDQAATNTPGKK
jgi:hypothetical protein